jgi:RNA 2',3'-cyclic 3'-phosphodiesterase
VIAGLARPPVAGLRWTTREQWHVTLRFLGSVDDPAPVADGLRGRLGASPSVVASPSGSPSVVAPSVVAALGPGVDRFGHRALHVPVSGLDEVAGRVADATVGVGRPAEDRTFAGHLTLARVSKSARVDLRPLAGQAVAARWTVADVCLVESRLAPTGARYEVLERFPVSSVA